MKPTSKNPAQRSRVARRQGVHILLPEDLADAVRQFAAARRVPLTAIYEAAISAYISPAAQDQRDALLSRHLMRLSRAVESVDWNAKLLIAMQRYQIELDLSFLPEPVTEEERRTVTEKGARRFDRFEQWLARQLAGQKSFHSGLQNHITPQANDSEAEETNLGAQRWTR